MTRGGADAVTDPIRLWRHLADRVATAAGHAAGPIGSLALLAVASGRAARKTFAGLVPGFAPWSGLRHPADEIAAFAASPAVWAVRDACSGFAADGTAVEPARRLARAALLTS